MNVTRARRRAHDVLIYLPSVTTVIAPASEPPAGGAEVQMGLLAPALAALGVRVCVAAFDGPQRLPDSIDGVDIIRRPAYQAHRGPAGKLAEATAIQASVAAADPEVVIARGATPWVGLTAAAARLQRRRFVYSSANLGDFDIARMERNRRNGILFELGVRLADRIVVQNDEQRRLCERRFGRNALVIKSIAQAAPARDHEPEAFLWAGRIVWYKRPLVFIELARSVPEATFWMVAVPEPGEDRQRLLDQVKRSARDVPNLELLSPRPRGELMALVERSVASVNTADFEGLSNAFLEGWARGVPALALTHDPDGLIERFGLGGFAGGSADKLAALARETWASRHAQQAVAQRCRRYVADEHSAETIYTQWLDALDFSPAHRPEPAIAGAL